MESKKNLSDRLRNRQQGFLVLTSVLLVCATVLAVASGIFLRSIGQMNQTGDSESSFKAWSTVNACGEYALGRLASIANGQPGWAYTGNESLTVETGTCYIYGVETINTSKLIKASSTVSNFTKKILIEVATNTPAVVISSWAEVADF